MFNMNRGVICILLFLMCINGNAQTRIVLQDSKFNKNTMASIEFTGLEAKQLWEYLNNIRRFSGSYIIADAGMSKQYLSTPALSCIKTDYSVTEFQKGDLRLYTCSIKLASNGLSIPSA